MGRTPSRVLISAGGTFYTLQEVDKMIDRLLAAKVLRGGRFHDGGRGQGIGRLKVSGFHPSHAIGGEPVCAARQIERR